MVDTLIDAMLRVNNPLIITKTSTQRRLLRNLSTRKVFKPIRFLTPKELKSMVFFETDVLTLYEASSYLNTSPAIARKYLDALYTVSTEESYEDAMLQRLNALKQYLRQKGVLKQQKRRLESIKNHHVIVAVDEGDDVFECALTSLKDIVSFQRVDVQKNRNHTLCINHFDDHEAEVVFIAEHIKKRIEQGTDPESIGIALANPAYESSIKMFFPLFGLPIAIKQPKPLVSIPITQQFLNAFERSEKTAIGERLEEALSHVPTKHPQTVRIKAKIIEVLNPFVMIDQPSNVLAPFIYDALNHTRVTDVEQNGIAVQPLSALSDHTFEHLFVLGCTEGHFPTYKIEDDLLSQTAKIVIGRRTAREENRLRKDALTRLIQTTEHVMLSTAKTVLSDNNHPATFLDTLPEHFTVTALPSIQRIDSTASEVYDTLYVKKQRDRALTYGEHYDTLEALHPMFEDRYTPHDNRFTPLSEDSLALLFPKPLALSYTTIQNYFKCQFRYLVENVLRADPPVQTFAMDLGSFIHVALEHHIESPPSDAQLEGLLQDIIEKSATVLTTKAQFFIRQSFAAIKRAQRAIAMQRRRSAYALYEREKRIKKTYTVDGKTITFTGVIDAILTRQTAHNLKLIIIDYKSGKPTLQHKNMLTGIGAQLPSYLVLLKEAFQNTPHQVKGFYEQTVLNAMPKQKQHETLESLYDKTLKWQGITVSDPHEIRLIDEKADDESFIKGLTINNNGAIKATSKTLDQEAIDQLANTMEQLIKDAAQSIMAGSFTINPKMVNNKDLSCAYCPFNDVCYKSRNDYCEATNAFDSLAALNEKLLHKGGAQ